jgi:ribosomal protein L21E
VFADWLIGPGQKVGGYKAGDKVLVKQEKKNKLSSFFNSEQFRVLQKNGNSVLVEADTGVQYKRTITHVKKLVTPDEKEKDVNTQESMLQESSISEPKLLDGRRLGEDEGGRVYLVGVEQRDYQIN